MAMPSYTSLEKRRSAFSATCSPTTRARLGAGALLSMIFLVGFLLKRGWQSVVGYHTEYSPQQNLFWSFSKSTRSHKKERNSLGWRKCGICEAVSQILRTHIRTLGSGKARVCNLAELLPELLPRICIISTVAALNAEVSDRSKL